MKIIHPIGFVLLANLLLEKSLPTSRKTFTLALGLSHLSL